MNLIPGEKKLFEADTKEFILTSHRLIFATGKIGEARFITIPLDMLSGSEFTFKSSPQFLLFGIAALLSMFVINSDMIRNFALLAGVLSFVWYLITRNRVLRFHSSSLSIDLKTSSMRGESVVNFVDEVMKARDQRLNEINCRK